MVFLTFSWWDYILFFIIIGFSVSTGIFYGFFVTNNSNNAEGIYLIRNIKTLPLTMSLIASTISVTDLLSVPAEIYTHGTQFWVEIFCLPVAGFIVYACYLPIMHRLNLSTTYQYLEKRFDKTVSKLALCSFLIPAIILIPLFIYASSLAFNQVSGFDLHIVAIVISSVCIFYTTFGGLQAVIWADTVQFTITLVSLIVALLLSTISLGGPTTIWETARRGRRLQFFLLDLNPTIRETFWSVFVGHVCRWTSFIITHPAAMQRILSVAKSKNSKSVMILFVSGMMIVKSILCFSGLIIYSKYFDCDPFAVGDIKKIDQIVPYYILDVAGSISGLGTLFIAGLIANALSVLSTLLNVCSYIIHKDFIAQFLPTNTSEKWYKASIKTVSLLLGVFALTSVLIAEKSGSLFESSYILIGSVNGALLGIFTMGIFFPFANTKGALSGMVVSVSLMLLFIIKSQIYIRDGIIKYETKPLSIHGCNMSNFNVSFSKDVVPIQRSKEVFWIFRISFHYYTLMGCLVCMIVGLLVSWLFKEKHTSVKKDLFCPVLHRLLFKHISADNYETVLDKELM